MSKELICEDCGCPFLLQEEDGYYCEDCQRHYTFDEAFSLFKEYRKHTPYHQ